MQAQLLHDPARGAGYGIIDLQAFEGQETDVLFSLRRASDGKYLGVGGWLEAEQRLAPDLAQLQGERLQLLVGPAVVDMLDMPDSFAITAYAAEGEGRRYELEIGGLLSSDPAGGQSIAQPASAPLSLSSMPDMLLDPAPEPQAEPLPLLDLEVAPEPPMPDMLLDPTPEPQAEPLPEHQPDPEPEPGPPLPVLKDPVEHKSKAPLILLLALVCVAGGVYWRQSQSAAPMANATAPAPSKNPGGELRFEIGAQQRDDANSSNSAQKRQSAALNLPPLQRARELLRAGISPEQAVETAKSMQAPEGADGAFLLLEDAAQKGAPEAMLGLARFYDPADAAPKGSILPDPEQARDWYNKAKDQGQSAADDKLKALRAWAQGAKDRDPQAKSLLESWK